MNIHEQETAAWRLDEPAVTTLIVLAPSEELLKSPEKLGRAMADAIGRDVDLATPDQLPADVAWMAMLHIEDLVAPLMCWPEPHAAEGTGLESELPSSSGLMVQTLLHPEDPLTSMGNLLRLLALAAPESAGVLDADTGRWLPRLLLMDEVVSAEIEPSEELLWIVESTMEGELHRMQTCGLERCGHRELAMSGINETQLESAADLIASLAALVLETPLPTSGVIEIGPELEIGVSGNPDQTDAIVELTHAEHDGPPTEVLQRVSDDVAAVYRSQRSGLRQAAMAKATWDRLIQFYPALMKAHATCYLEVPFEDDSGQDDRRIHVWMEIVEQREHAFMAVPAHDADALQGISDTPIQIQADEICSWRVIHEDVAWGPEQSDALFALFRENNHS